MYNKKLIEELNPLDLNSFDDLQKLDYLTMIIKETLRMFPPAPLLNRTTIEETELAGYKIPANTEILISPWTIQRSNRYWINPDQFIPERWSEDRLTFSFVAFSGGPRACLGKMFAFMETKLVISMILKRYKVKIVPKQKVQTEVAITLRAKYGLWCTIEKRDESSD